MQGGDVERAAEWICSHPDDIAAMELDVTTSREPSTSSEQPLPDGSGSMSVLLLLNENCVYIPIAFCKYAGPESL